MPLYWYTDKPIGNYRLKKPIEVEMDCTNDESWSIHVFGYDSELYANGWYHDESVIEFLQDIIDKNYRMNITNEPYWKEEFDDFRVKLMPYLEKIKSPMNCERCGVSLDLEYPHKCKKEDLIKKHDWYEMECPACGRDGFDFGYNNGNCVCGLMNK